MKVFFKILLNICIIILAFFAGNFYAIEQNTNNNNKSNCKIIDKEKQCNCDKICDDLLKKVISNKATNNRIYNDFGIKNNDIKQLEEELEEEIIEEINTDDFVIIDENNNDNNIDNSNTTINNNIIKKELNVKNIENTATTKNIENVIDITNMGNNELVNDIIVEPEEEFNIEDSILEEIVAEENVQQ